MSEEASGPGASLPRFEALLLDLGPAAGDGCDAELGGQIEELCGLGMHVAVVNGSEAAQLDGWLRARPRGPGSLHLLPSHGSEVHGVGPDGPRLTPGRIPSPAEVAALDGHAAVDSIRWVLSHWWSLGVGGCLVLVARPASGSLGGPAARTLRARIPAAERTTAVSVDEEALRDLLRGQLVHRRGHAPPRLDAGAGWTLTVDGIDPELERAHEALLTVADGCIGTRGTPAVGHPATSPLVVAAGVYCGAERSTHLCAAPVWNDVTILADPDPRLRRTLDLHTGVLRQEIAHEPSDISVVMWFSSMAQPGTAVLRAVGRIKPPAAPLRPAGEDGADIGLDGDAHWARVDAGAGGLAVAARDEFDDSGSARSLERVAVYRVDAESRPSAAEAVRTLRARRAGGFERLLAEHRAAWGRRWAAADVRIDGDPDLQLGVRLALFHLMASAGDRGECAVGARGLTGPAYLGHVFWDSDVFVLPFLAATHPPAARAILDYRVRRLPMALAAARALGRDGARFPWESAGSGADVTPAAVRDRSGRDIEILTGRLEEHIVSDVAWAAVCYGQWTGDADFAAGVGARLLTETARYWASRIERDDDGRGHVRGVIGPDEYHVGVDDNAFTNVMARWNLRYAADLPASAGVSPAERRRWLDAAESVVDGYDADTGLYEQFAGYFALEPLVIAEIAPQRPIAADLLLGQERVTGAQVVKQTDVLMLHHLVPEETAPGSLSPNLAFYEPRTAHASSLSPGVHAALLARDGQLKRARDLLALTARIDRDDISETTSGGVHLAAMGSVWQALVMGFAGARPAGEALELDPRLPSGWDALDLRLRFRGAAVRVRVEPDTTRIVADRPIGVRLAGGDPVEVVGEARLDHRARRSERAIP